MTPAASSASGADEPGRRRRRGRRRRCCRGCRCRHRCHRGALRARRPRLERVVSVSRAGHRGHQNGAYHHRPEHPPRIRRRRWQTFWADISQILPGRWTATDRSDRTRPGAQPIATVTKRQQGDTAEAPIDARRRPPDDVVSSPCCVVTVAARERQFRLDWTAPLRGTSVSHSLAGARAMGGCGRGRASASLKQPVVQDSQWRDDPWDVTHCLVVGAWWCARSG